MEKVTLTMSRANQVTVAVGSHTRALWVNKPGTVAVLGKVAVTVLPENGDCNYIHIFKRAAHWITETGLVLVRPQEGLQVPEFVIHTTYRKRSRTFKTILFVFVMKTKVCVKGETVLKIE